MGTVTRNPVAVLALVLSLVLLGALSIGPPALAQAADEDDAGSGRDAGTTPATAVPIDRGRAYDATLALHPGGSGNDRAGDLDWFAFIAVAGEELAVRVLAQAPDRAPNCIQIFDAAGVRASDLACGGELLFTVPADGTFHAAFGYFLAAPTSYTFGIDAAAPPPPPPLVEVIEQDDAGSGRDAGEASNGAVSVHRGVQYEATLAPTFDPLNNLIKDSLSGDFDVYAFEAVAGEELRVEVLSNEPPGAVNCIWVQDVDGEELASSGCSDSLSFTAPADGTYYARFGYITAIGSTYRFGIDIQSPANIAYRTGGRDMEPDPDQPTVVVAVADSGVNPYHEAYHRPHLTVHPCEWVAGFDDCDIPALPLSIGEYDSYREAYAADLELWQSLEVGQWYWIPRTNIIGAVCDGTTNASGNPPPVTPQTPCIHDEHGHGTGTTSSVLSEAPDALLLVHEGNSGASAMAYAPVVPDIQSHSWGPPAPVPLHAGDPVLGSLGLTLADRGAEDPATVFFIAAGNEAPFPTILDWSRVHPSVQIVGGGFPGRATPFSWSMFDFASWFCRPTAVPDSQRAVRSSYCGTSFAAPTVAGAAAAALLEMRRAEGFTGRSTAEMVTPTISREMFLQALRSAATYDAQPRYANRDSGLPGEVAMPAGSEHLFWGYGWLDAGRVEAVVACATGGICPEKSEEARAWNDARQQARHAQTDPVLGESPGDPAG